MFIALACLPLTVLTGFGWLPALALVLASSPAAVVYAIHGDSIDFSLQVQDYVLTYTSTALVVIYFLLVGCSVLYVRLETYFDRCVVPAAGATATIDDGDHRRPPLSLVCINTQAPVEGT